LEGSYDPDADAFCRELISRSGLASIRLQLFAGTVEPPQRNSTRSVCDPFIASVP
jgi:hypothetical protein